MTVIAPPAIIHVPDTMPAPGSAPDFSESRSLNFALDRDECLMMIKKVLTALNVHATGFADKILCILREGDSTYAFELTIECNSSRSSTVHMNNFRRIQSFTELIAVRHQLVAIFQDQYSQAS